MSSPTDDREELERKLSQLSIRDYLVEFLEALDLFCEVRYAEWLQPQVDDYLTALEACIRDRQLPRLPTWKLVAEMLLSAVDRVETDILGLETQGPPYIGPRLPRASDIYAGRRPNEPDNDPYGKELDQRIDSMTSGDELSEFVAVLRADFLWDPEAWAQWVLHGYVNTIARWTDGVPAAHRNTGREEPVDPDWPLVAMMLYSPKIYE